MNEQDTPSSLTLSCVSQLENARTWCYLMLVASLCRLIWVINTQANMDASASVTEWFHFALMGIRYDSVAVTHLMIPFVVLSGLICFFPGMRNPIRKARQFWAVALIIAFPPIAFANATYYLEFNNVFDAFIFEFFEGNAVDVVTIAAEDYGLVQNTLLSIGIITVLLIPYFRYIGKPLPVTPALASWLSKRGVQVAFTLALACSVTLGLRGRIGTRPLQRIDSGVTMHRVLNLGTLNPFYSLRTAFKSHLYASDYFAEERVISIEELSSRTWTVAGTLDRETPPAGTVDGIADGSNPAFWQRTAAGPPNCKPSHIFVLFIESYDSWPFLEKYRDLQLVEAGKQVGAEGHLMLNYLPGANSSVKSALVCVQGLFDTNRAQQQSMPTCLVNKMSDLGYLTRSVNSFTSEWGDAERIAREQGFEEAYFTAHIKPGGETANKQVHDRTLYDFAAEKLSYDQPTFNFIRASSYHGPWEVDLEAEDCTVDPFPEHLKCVSEEREEQLRLAYGHLKYSDRMAAEFVRRMCQRYPDSLFVITGDHYGRHFIDGAPDPYEGASVPLIMYGPQVLEGTTIPEGMAGSHVDLTATLVELAAPKGFTYTAIGKSLLSPCSDPVGIGEDHVLFPQVAVSLRQPPQCQVLPWLQDTISISEQEQQQYIERARELHDAFYGVSYMISRRMLLGPKAYIAEHASDGANRY